MIEFLKGTVTKVDWAINAGIVALTIALCAIFAFLSMVPHTGRMETLQAEIVKKNEDLTTARTLSANIDELREEARDQQGLVDVFEKRLPKEQEIPSLLRTFEDYGDEIGLRVNLASKQLISDKEKETIPYGGGALWYFHQITTFVNLLERNPRYFKISELKIGEQEEGVSEAKFVLSTYRFIEAAPEEHKKGGKK